MHLRGARQDGRTLRQIAAAGVTLVWLAACASAPSQQYASHSDTDGISGTGVVAQNVSSDGISGTGLVAQSDMGGDGIGGTGVVAHLGGDGIGGTGIVGTISGFGSIIVNGLKLDYDTDTIVESDGRPAALTDLKIGQVIEGVAFRDASGTLHLEELEIRHAVTGPISSIDHDTERLVVLGQTVRVNLAGDGAQKTAFSTLKVGDMVRVSGLRLGDGMIVASRVDQTDDDGRVLVRGPVSTSVNNTITIGDLAINAGDAALADALRAGDRAFVAGRMIGEQFVADVIVDKPALPFDDSVTDVSLEGYVPDSAETALSVQGVPVTGLDLPSDVKPGDRVVVSGRVGADGTVAARQIERVRTVITVLRPTELMRPARMRPMMMERPERIERPERPVERPVQPERPRERPGAYRPPMV
jgi:hypothetical protein